VMMLLIPARATGGVEVVDWQPAQLYDGAPYLGDASPDDNP
jgi:hypothetical protein